MGYVYYGNYAQYFEVARVEALREMGLSYKEMEADGVMLPVVHFNIDYKKAGFYDDELTIKTTIKKLPSTVIKFDYETYNEKNELLNTAHTALVFINMKTGKPTRSPDSLNDKLINYTLEFDFAFDKVNNVR